MTETNANNVAEPRKDGTPLTGVHSAATIAGDSFAPAAPEPKESTGDRAAIVESDAKKDRRWLKGLGLWASGFASAVLAGVIITTYQFNLERSAEEVIAPPVAQRLGCSTGWSEQTAGKQFLEIQLSQSEEDCWQTSLDGVNPGDEFDVLVWWRNWTGHRVDDTTIRAYLADGLEYVPGTATWHNANHPAGLAVVGDLFGTGINVGSYMNSANLYILFTARMSETFDVPCGFAVTTVAAQLPTQPAPDDVWTTAGLVTNARC